MEQRASCDRSGSLGRISAYNLDVTVDLKLRKYAGMIYNSECSYAIRLRFRKVFSWRVI